jgi:hypothetical protein
MQKQYKKTLLEVLDKSEVHLSKLLTAFLSFNVWTYEDAFVVSESFAKDSQKNRSIILKPIFQKIPNNAKLKTLIKFPAEVKKGDLLLELDLVKTKKKPTETNIEEDVGLKKEEKLEKSFTSLSLKSPVRGFLSTVSVLPGTDDATTCLIIFFIETSVPLDLGQKLSGVYGNKGVISKIVPDREMPFILKDETISPLEENNRVYLDVIQSALSVISRGNLLYISELEMSAESKKLLYTTNKIFNHLASPENPVLLKASHGLMTFSSLIQKVELAYSISSAGFFSNSQQHLGELENIILSIYNRIQA